MLGAAPQLLVVNAANVEAATFAEAARNLHSYLKRYEQDELPFVAARYEYQLEHVHAGWGPPRARWQIIPRGGVVERDAYTAEPKAKIYPAPRARVLTDVPEDDRLAYRGMAWEEWQAIRKRGYIQSSGTHNLDQAGLTFFGPADMAQLYATGFAPLAFKPAWRRPGVVIAISRARVLEHADLPQKIPAGEYALQGPLPAREIVAGWYLIPTYIRYGSVELTATPQGAREGSRSNPSVTFVVLPMERGHVR